METPLKPCLSFQKTGGRGQEGWAGQGRGGEGVTKMQESAEVQTLLLPAAPRVPGDRENLLDLHHLSAQKGPAGHEDPARRQLPTGRSLSMVRARYGATSARGMGTL